MKQAPASRIRDQRVDIKVSPQVYDELSRVKKLLEHTTPRSYSMSEVISLMYDWSEPKINDLTHAQGTILGLTTKKVPPGSIV